MALSGSCMRSSTGRVRDRPGVSQAPDGGPQVTARLAPQLGAQAQPPQCQQQQCRVVRVIAEQAFHVKAAYARPRFQQAVGLTSTGSQCLRRASRNSCSALACSPDSCRYRCSHPRTCGSSRNARGTSAQAMLRRRSSLARKACSSSARWVRLPGAAGRSRLRPCGGAARQQLAQVFPVAELLVEAAQQAQYARCLGATLRRCFRSPGPVRADDPPAAVRPVSG